MRHVKTTRGIVLASAIAAVLHGPALEKSANVKTNLDRDRPKTPEDEGILMLTNGHNFHTGREYNDVVKELDSDPLTDLRDAVETVLPAILSTFQVPQVLAESEMPTHKAAANDSDNIHGN